VVDNVLTTLQQLAQHHRKQFAIPVLAIGGSNGKTTTKELTVAVLSKSYKVHATAGNFNNHIGVPLTLLGMPDDTEIAVIEIGANHLMETAFLAELAAPNYALVTNNGKDHLEGFGSLENVKKANAELYEFIRKTNGMVFVNYQDTDLMQSANGLKAVFYHTNPNEEAHGTVTANYPKLVAEIQIQQEIHVFESALAGSYNLINILAATSVGHYFKVPVTAMMEAIQQYQPTNNRSQWTLWNTNKVLLDCYNANPSSMQTAITSFQQIPASNKMLILGDMLELGEYSLQEHSQLLNEAQSCQFDELVFVGQEWMKCKNQNQGKWFLTTAEAKEWLLQATIENYLILVKGSRGIALEKIFQYRIKCITCTDY
jgi:UDP-N-acetylmuramoyl-tripeptide--D-alanyl-D-alanine ligase